MITIARTRESYADRVARLESQGYSRAQARGHPGKGEPPIVAVRTVADGRTARMDTLTIGGKERLVVSVITVDAKGRPHLRSFEMDPAAKAKLKAQLIEFNPDAPEPEES